MKSTRRYVKPLYYRLTWKKLPEQVSGQTLLGADDSKGVKKMQIGDLKPGMRRVDVTGTIHDIETPRDVQTKFGPGQVATATLQDTSGAVKVVLWNENISKVTDGEEVSIENGYVDSFRGELQLNIGRYGKIVTP